MLWHVLRMHGFIEATIKEHLTMIAVARVTSDLF